MTGKLRFNARELFDAALDQPSESRERWLRHICGSDTTLAREVIELLRARDDASQAGFIDQPAKAPAMGGGASQEDSEDRVGPYKLLRELGQGGMGSVYLAVRADDTFRKVVALKIIKRERCNPEFLDRFRQERQILAGLDHPHIARILDGGTTPEGLPFYVMEYVQGRPLNQHCSDRRLGLDATLRLFLQICSAVQYLHENLIIHRDLKPDNILVTDTGVAKLLDFGIAKLQRIGEPDRTIEYAHGPMLTLGYASPEQLGSNSVTKASDIYSLGVILYELLTGRRPYDDGGPPQASIAARMCAAAPEPPSAKIREDMLGRPETRSQLRRRLLGDLDNVLLKALAREPAERYASAREFAADLENFLEHKPVNARRPTLLSRTAKFVRRNRIAVAAVIALLFLASGGTWQAVQARIHQERSDSREAEVQRLLQILTARQHNGGLSRDESLADIQRLREAFQKDLPAAIASRSGSTVTRRKIVRDALEYLDRAGKGAAGDAEMSSHVATAYARVAEVQFGSEGKPSLGDRDGAVATYRQAAGVLMQLPAGEQQLRLYGEIRVKLAALGVRDLSERTIVKPEPVKAGQTTAASQQRQPSARDTQADRESTTVAAPSQAQSADDTHDWRGLRSRIGHADSNLSGAREAVEELRRVLPPGETLRTDLTASVRNATLHMDNAKHDYDEQRYDAALDEVRKAEYETKRALRILGQ